MTPIYLDEDVDDDDMLDARCVERKKSERKWRRVYARNGWDRVRTLFQFFPPRLPQPNALLGRNVPRVTGFHVKRNIEFVKLFDNQVYPQRRGRMNV